MSESNMKFKTNLNCGGCISRIKDDMNDLAGEGKWKVDTHDANKTLTITNTGIKNAEVLHLLKAKGFTAQQLDN